MSDGMKLYVWESVLCDYTCGMVVVLAHSKSEAIETATRQNALGSMLQWDLREVEPKVVDVTKIKRPRSWVVWGGG